MALAKGEVGIREKKAIPALKEFCERDLLPFIKTRFAEKPKTVAYYEWGVKVLTAYPQLANVLLDQITTERIAGFIEKNRAAERELATINRLLQILRRALRLASVSTAVGGRA